jgi:pimeloyl-ACP methyl ester carboxylesterase
MGGHRRILAPQARPASLRSAATADADYGVGDGPDWRKVPWPQHLRAMTVNARRVHLAEIGSGRGAPILLLHGLGGRWQHWLENIPRFAAGRRVIAVDLPGFGRSQLPLEPISIALYARTLDRVCDLLELDAAVVLGSSLGAMVATEMALRYPQRVERLVLVGAACLAPTEMNAQRAHLALAALGRITRALPRGIDGALTRPRARHVAFAGVIRHPTLIATDMLYELTGGERPSGSLDALDALSTHEIQDRLGSITVPTLVVHGRNDLLIPCSDGTQLAAMIDGAELNVFEDTGHLPMIERPARFNSAVLDFI